MLTVLCGTANVQKILVFLFVNGKCYGTQLHRLLKTPLTPLQNTLARLERGGLITSYYEGKTRVYQFNPAYPLLNELEPLLKKAYALLSPQEKKQYYVIKEDDTSKISSENKLQVLLAFWDKLATVKGITFKALTKSKEDTGWNGTGKGEVVVTREGNHLLIFKEKGHWQGRQEGEINFSNVFRWTLDRQAQLISLEHLRRGPDQPVFLFHLTPTGNHSLSSVDSHLCEGDIYFGQIHFDQHNLRLDWRVIGPKKNEEIHCYYY